MSESRIRWALKSVGLWLIALAFFGPVLWIFLAAFKSPAQILHTPPLWIFKPTLSGLNYMVHAHHFWLHLENSVLVSVSGVLIALIVSYIAAFSFSRFRTRGTDFSMFILLSMRMVPGAAVIVPVYMMYRAFGWSDTYFGMIFFYAMYSIPFAVWILKGFVDGVSRRFDEAAMVDGGSLGHVMLRVIPPQIIPGLFAAFIFNMIFVWNEYLFDFMLGGSQVATMPVAIAGGLYTVQGIDWQYIASLSFVFTLPLIVAVFFLQRYLLVGMTFGTVRGEV